MKPLQHSVPSYRGPTKPEDAASRSFTMALLGPFLGPSPRARLLRTFVPLAIAGEVLHGLLRPLLFRMFPENPLLLHGITTVGLLVVTVAAVMFLGSRLGRAIEDAERRSAESADELAKTHRALLVLSETNQTLVRATEEQAFLDDVCRIMVEIGGYRMAWIGSVEHDEARSVRPLAQAGFEEGYLEKANITWADKPRGRGPVGTSVRTRKPAIVRNTETDPMFAPWRDAAIAMGYRSVISLPLEIHGEVSAILAIYDDEIDPFADAEVRLLCELSLDLSFGINQLRMRREHEQTAEEMRALSERHLLLAGMLDRSAQPFTIGYADGRIGICNAAYRALIGYEHEDVSGINWIRDLTPPEWRDREAAALEELQRGGRPVRYEKEYIRKDGSRIPVELFVHLARDTSGARQYYYSFITDLTSRKRELQELIQAKEEAEHSVRLKDAFIANISHEIRTPLMVILGYTKLVEECFAPQADEEHRRFFRSIEYGAQRLMRTVDMILDISRMQAGVYAPMFAEYYLPSLIEQLVTASRPAVEEKSLSLSWNNTWGELLVRIDRHCVTEAISNLLSNAIKFSHRGGIEVALYRGEQGHPLLDIRDSGIGISDEYLAHLFEPYSQEEVGYTRAYDGIGLGLALVKNYLALHDISIAVHSTKHLGTTFTLDFQSCLCHVAADAGTAIESAADASPRSLAAPAPAGTVPSHVLLVEDDPGTVDLVRHVLQRAFRISHASTAAGAWTVLQGGGVDLILMDISLQGGVHGLELTRRIRADAEFASIPIIAVTAYAFDQDRANCLEAGCNDYLAKPFDAAVLLEKIQAMLPRTDAAPLS